MQQSTEVASRVERGAQLLKAGALDQAVANFTEASQLDPNAPEPYLGMAEVSVARGDVASARQACKLTSQAAPGSASDWLARAIEFTLDGKYIEAIEASERSTALDPVQAYAYALRGYCLRRTGQRYEGALVDARAARIWGDRDFGHLFPASLGPVEAPERVETRAPMPVAEQQRLPRTPRPWDQRRNIDRRLVRLRYLTNGLPVFTYLLIAINVAIYLASAAVSLNFFNPAQANNPIYQWGAEQGNLIFHDPTQAYRIFTAMFLHYNLQHIGFNMVSLFFVGVITERIFGPWKFLLIYIAAGLIGGVAQAVLSPDVAAIGASGAIFGIFGAFGAFAWLRRRTLGPAGNAIIQQWLFWLVLNLVFDFFIATDIAIADHIGGLVSGFLLGALIVSLSNRRSVTPRPY